jgi:hypothetical protein
MALNDQLLNHFKEKFGIVTVVNATFYEVDGKVPLISFDTLKMSNITSEGQQKEIRGGQGAELLLQYDFGRTANIEITDALVSMGSLEYLFGGSLTAGTFNALRRAEGVLINSGGTAFPASITGKTLIGTPIVVLTKADGEKIRLEGSAATLPTVSSHSPGDKFVIWYEEEYTTTAEDNDPPTDVANVREMILKATDFPPTVRFIGETIVLDADKGKKIAFQIEVPKLKLNANFTLSFDAEGDPSVFDFSGVALSHNGELIKVRTLGYYAD